MCLLKGSFPKLLCLEQMTQIKSEIKYGFFNVKYRRTCSLSFLSFKNCCELESVEWQPYNQTLKGVLL